MRVSERELPGGAIAIRIQMHQAPASDAPTTAANAPSIQDDSTDSPGMVSDEMSRLFGMLLGGELLSEVASAQSERPATPMFRMSSPFAFSSIGGGGGGGGDVEPLPFMVRMRDFADAAARANEDNSDERPSGGADSGIAAATTTQAAASHPCMSDAQRLCKDVLERGRGGSAAGSAGNHGFMHGGAHGAHAHIFMLHQCLADNLSDLSDPACHDRIATAPVVACRDDIREQCGDDVANARGEGAHHRVRHCLRKALKRGTMGEACRASLAAVPPPAASQPVAPVYPLIDMVPATATAAAATAPPPPPPPAAAAVDASVAMAAPLTAAAAAAAASVPASLAPATASPSGIPRAVIFVLAGLGFAVIVAAVILVFNRSRSSADGYTPLLV